MKSWHPERILMLVLAVLLLTTWGLAALGWIAGIQAYYSYVFQCGVTIIVIAFDSFYWVLGLWQIETQVIPETAAQAMLLK